MIFGTAALIKKTAGLDYLPQVNLYYCHDVLISKLLFIVITYDTSSM